MTFLSAFDADEIRRLEAAGAAKRVKRDWIEKGYMHQMSLYGASYNTARDRLSARRIEILSDASYTRELIQLAYDAFSTFIPPFKYSLWVLHSCTKKIELAGGYSPDVSSVA